MSEFTVGQQVKVIGNGKNEFLSALMGQEVASHAVPNGEIVTVVEVKGGGIIIDSSNIELIGEGANSEVQFLRNEFIEAV